MPFHLPLRPIRRLLLLSALVLVAGCATTVTTQVTPFHELTGSLAGQRFVIVPSADQQDSLEFGAYADLVRQALVEKGLVDAGNDRASADLGVSMSYEVIGRGSSMRPMTGTTGSIGFGAGSGGFSGGGIGIGIGFPIGGGSSGEVAFQRTLHVRIDRLHTNGKPGAPAPDPTSPPGMPAPANRVFEARAISEGESSSIAPVMRAMVHAIFDDFPGESGRTRVVNVPLNESR